MSQEVARWLVALGAVAASVGATILGMGTSYLEAADWMVNLGAALTIGGILALLIGAYVYRAAGPDTNRPS